LNIEIWAELENCWLNINIMVALNEIGKENGKKEKEE
jgi:hypothetical protein